MVLIENESVIYINYSFIVFLFPRVSTFLPRGWGFGGRKISGVVPSDPFYCHGAEEDVSGIGARVLL
jgi:hypothetical protein